MGSYIGFMHLKEVLVKEGDILNGQHNVGVIGNSGSSPSRPMAAHLHLQYETMLPNTGKLIRGFDKYADPTNPSVIINKYGKMCQNDITQPYWNKYINSDGTSLNSLNICDGHHAGIDYSGNIDEPHESKYAYTPAAARCKVIEIGSDPYDFPNWGGFGNYVIIEILGDKVEPSEYTKTYNKAVKNKSQYNKPDGKHFLYDYYLNQNVATFRMKDGKKSGTLKNGSMQTAYPIEKKDRKGNKLAKFYSSGNWHTFIRERKN